MKTTSRFVEADSERLAVTEFRVDRPVAQMLLLHGAGDSHRGRTTGLASALADCAFDVVTVDFAGHGDSTGSAGDLTLERRAVQAREVLHQTASLDVPRFAGGISMGAQTAFDLLDEDFAGLLLLCPAVYAQEVRATRLGDPAFPMMLRSDESWKSSPSFNALRKFDGPVQFVLPEHEDVVPSAVTEALIQCRAERDHPPLILAGAGHSLGKWMLEHHDAARLVAERVASMAIAI